MTAGMDHRFTPSPAGQILSLRPLYFGFHVFRVDMNRCSPLSVVQIISGAGGMYCGSCLHGNSLAAALLEAGHDVMLVPLYTPVRTDGDSVRQERLAFGGLNVFLQERFPLFRKAPAFLDHWLDHPGLVRWASRWTGKTDAARLGALTVSMLRGPAGRQAKELHKLLDLLAAIPKIHVVHLSNVLLAGLAEPIRAGLNVPVVVSLTGEDSFIERLPEPYAGQTRRELQRAAQSMDALVALNRYFAHRMADYLNIPVQTLHVIPPGLKLAGHAAASEPPFSQPDPSARETLRIGYFSRICHDKGLHLLADALVVFAQRSPGYPFVLDAAGYLGPQDRRYLRDVERRFEHAGLRGRFRYLGSPDRAGKIAFLRSVDVVCLPSVFPESKGMVALEAWANGRPVIAPDAGAFPELAADTGGGLLFDPGSAESLAAAILHLAGSRELAARLGRRGLEAVRDRYHDRLLASRTAALYASLLRNRQAAGGSLSSEVR